MHRNIKNNQIKILSKSFDRNNLSKAFWTFNIVLIVGYMILTYLVVNNIVQRKQIALNIEDARASIGELESKFFTQMSDMDSGDLAFEGYVEPETISFAKIEVSNSVSLAEDGL